MRRTRRQAKARDTLGLSKNCVSLASAVVDVVSLLIGRWAPAGQPANQLCESCQSLQNGAQLARGCQCFVQCLLIHPFVLALLGLAVQPRPPAVIARALI